MISVSLRRAAGGATDLAVLEDLELPAAVGDGDLLVVAGARR
ncbi:hypothetical protein AB0J14_35725 [Micromonospora arborensis]